MLPEKVLRKQEKLQNPQKHPQDGKRKRLQYDDLEKGGSEIYLPMFQTTSRKQ